MSGALGKNLSDYNLGSSYSDQPLFSLIYEFINLFNPCHTHEVETIHIPVLQIPERKREVKYIDQSL